VRILRGALSLLAGLGSILGLGSRPEVTESELRAAEAELVNAPGAAPQYVPNHRSRSGGHPRVPPGFKDHNPAGSKLARKAYEGKL
jgi:hypothetical protein